MIVVGSAALEVLMVTAAGSFLCTYQNWKRSASNATSAIWGTVIVRCGLAVSTVITAVKYAPRLPAALLFRLARVVVKGYALDPAVRSSTRTLSVRVSTAMLVYAVELYTRM